MAPRLLGAIVLLSLVLASCTKEGSVNAAGRGAGASAQGAPGGGAGAATSKDAAVAALKTQQAELNGKIAALESKAAALPEETRAEANKGIEELKQLRAAFAKRLAEASAAGSAEWQKVAGDLRASLSDLDKRIAEVGAKMP